MIEQAKIDILAWQMEQMSKGESSELTDSKVKEILKGKEYLKDGTLDNEGFKNKDGDIIFEYTDIYIPPQITPSETFNPETLEIGTAINSDKYGWKVNGYTVTTDDFLSGVWRLFYQDSKYTYLITDECVGSYSPYDYYETETKEDGTLKYQTGADVSIIGQRLNKLLLEDGTFFIEENENESIRATAWFTDEEIWKQYKNKDAVFAIASPTIELYKASFNATASENNATELTVTITAPEGYNVTGTDLKAEYNKGIYNNDTSLYWWIASPGVTTNKGNGIAVSASSNKIAHLWLDMSLNPVRPIVSIPTSVFDSKYASTLVNE